MSIKQRWRKLRKSSRLWSRPWVPLTGGTLGGLFLALAATSIEATARGLTAFAYDGSWTFLWAFLFGFIAVALPVHMVQRVGTQLRREVRGLINVRPLVGDRLLGADPYAMDAPYAENVLTQVDRGARSIVELGSGHSTVLIAERLEARGGEGRVVALDHMETYAARTREWIRERGLEHRATVVHAPIADVELDGELRPWYSVEAATGELPERIDLLLVDGPPGRLGPEARWPALPVLEDRLAAGAVILMDDGDRAEETRVAMRWHERLGGKMRYLPGGKGGWMLRKRG
jgi:hypothetical protein